MIKDYLHSWIYGDDLFLDIDYQKIHCIDLSAEEISVTLFEHVLIYLYVGDSEVEFLKFSKDTLTDHLELNLDKEGELIWGLKIPFSEYENKVVHGNEIWLQISTITTNTIEYPGEDRKKNKLIPLAKVAELKPDILAQINQL